MKKPVLYQFLGVLLILGYSFLGTSCVALKGKKHTYLIGEPMDVSGAEVSIAFRPEGTRNGSFMFSAMVAGAGRAVFDGPFRWRVDAVADTGEFEKLVIHRIRTRTEKTKRDEWFPAEELGRVAEFKQLRSVPGKSRARYPIPGLLRVMPEEDGGLDVWVDLSISKQGRWSRKMLHYQLKPTVKSQNEFIFLPVEVAQNIGKPFDEQADSMWE